MRAREAWRHAHGWTLQETADRINACPARQGAAVAADASLVGKWEKWPGPSSRRPTLAALSALADAYACEIEQLLDLVDRRALPESDQRIVRHAPSVARADATPSAPTPAGVTDLAGAELVHAAAQESALWAAWAEATNVGDIAIDQLMADTRALSADYLVADPAQVFARTRRLRDRVFSLVEGRQHPRQSRDLYVVAGYLCTLLAWMSSDLGQLRDAETQGRAAYLCAELAGHCELSAWVLSTRSKISFWDGRFQDALAYARRGAALRPEGTVGALLACQEADSWSQLGAKAEALSALARATDNHPGLDDEIGGLFSCPEARLANYATAIRQRLGDPAGALRVADSAMEIQPAHSYGTTAQMRIAAAFAHISLGSPDGALETVRPVLALASDHRLEPVTRRMRELAAALARSPVTSAAPAVALQTEIESWCADSAPRRLALSPGEGPG